MTAQIRFLKIDEGYHVDHNPVREAATAGIYATYIKRILDVVLVLATAAISLPLIAIACVLVALDGGPVFFVQHRVGRDGIRFPMLKLRTMRADAEQHLQAHLAANANDMREWQVTQKLRNDPRITWVGRLLRKTSLDELPQLWNVLKGDMALVGPRPMMVGQMPIYQGDAYFALRPGLTGLWQVTARNSSSFEARAQFDTTYAAKQSLFMDLSLMARTIAVVVRGTGY